MYFGKVPGTPEYRLKYLVCKVCITLQYYEAVLPSMLLQSPTDEAGV